MTSQPQHRPLTDRDREILKDVIGTYLATAEPVSSRTVAKHSQHDLSAASIRNIMADLDELGYLAQPHTSAGRVPTPLGYHLFIDSLMQVEDVSEEERRLIESELETASHGDELTTVASTLLSRLTRQVGIVVTPAIGTTVLKHVEFAPLSGRRVLCVTVSSAGFIDNKVVNVDEDMSREELLRVSNYINENFAGYTLREIRDRLLFLMEDTRAQMDQLLRRAIKLADGGIGLGHQPAVVVDGTESLLTQPELSDMRQVQRLLETFRDKALLVGVLNECLEGEGVRVWIGNESEVTSDLDFSLIVRKYDVGDRPVGSVAIFGPSRMEYSRVIPLVDYVGRRLSEALSQTA